MSGVCCGGLLDGVGRRVERVFSDIDRGMVGIR